MRIAGLTFTLVVAQLSTALAQPAPSMPSPQVVPPSRVVRPTFPNYSQRPPDETYRLSDRQLNCTLADGRPVGISIARESDNFAFLAVRGPFGPTILANDRRVLALSPDYAAFSFFRECAIHSLADVSANAANSSADYSREVIRGADCLAVLPTLRTQNRPDSEKLLVGVARALKDEYGANYPVAAVDLRACMDPEQVARTARSVRQSR